MKPFLWITALTILASCAGVDLRRSEAKETPLAGDPAQAAQVRLLLNQGNLALKRRDYRTAEKKAQESLQLLQTYQGHYLLGMVYVEEGREEEALQSLLRAEELAPDQEQILLSIALIYGSRGNTDRSLARFDRLLKLRPDEPAYNYRAGVLYREKKDYEQALSLLKKADVEGFEFRDQALLQLGDVCLELRRFDEADEYYRRAQKANPAMQDALKGSDASRTARLIDQGNAFYKKGDYVRAEAAYREAMQISPRSSAPRLQLGSVYLARGDLAAARREFEEALRISPESKDARILVASTARKQADYDRALKVIQEGLHQNPDDAELLNQLGLHHAAQGDREKAVMIFERILAKQESFIPARKNVIFQYIELGRFAEARRHLALIQKTESGPEWKETAERIQIHEMLERGHALFAKRQYRRAEAEYAKALQLKKDYVPSLIATGRARLQYNNFRGAEAAFRAARAIEPANPEALEGLLSLYQKTGNVRDRSAIQREIQQMSAKNPEVLLALARMKEDEGLRDEAYQEYRSLLDRLPDNAYVKRRMAGIQIQYAIEKNALNRFDEAMSHLKEAERLDPAHPALARNRQIIEENRRYRHLIPDIERAEAAFRRKDYRKAEEQFARLYRQWQRPSFLVRLAEIRFESGRETEGQAMLLEALNRDPAGIEYREAIYARLLDRRQLDEAEKGFKQILAEDESAYFSSYKLGIIEMLRRRYDRAQEYMQQALLYRPEFLPARIARGVIYYEQKKPAEARREFEEARRMKGHGQELALLNLALMDWNDGSQKSEPALLELTRIYPDFADPYYHLAYLQYAKGNLRDALQNIDRALAIQKTPEFLYARIEILDKMKSGELEAAGRQFLKEYPGDRRAGEVRRLLASATGQKDFIEPAMRYPAGNDPVYAFADSFLIVRKNQILGVERGTDRVLFQIRVNPIAHHLDGFLMVLEKGRLRTFDPVTGEELLPLSVPDTACKILGTGGDPIVQLKCANGPAVFRKAGTISEFTAPQGARLLAVSSGPEKTYAVYSGRTVTLLDSELKPKAEFTASSPVEDLYAADRSGIIVQTASELIFLDSGNLAQVKRVPLLGRNVVFTDQLLLVSGREVYVFSGDGKEIGLFRLPENPINVRGISYISPDRMSFIDRNRRWLLVNREGRVLLREDLSGASIYSVRVGK
jgi:tetratricopeptide (TPR) repeat protein